MKKLVFVVTFSLMGVTAAFAESPDMVCPNCTDHERKVLALNKQLEVVRLANQLSNELLTLAENPGSQQILESINDMSVDSIREALTAIQKHQEQQRRQAELQRSRQIVGVGSNTIGQPGAQGTPQPNKPEAKPKPQFRAIFANLEDPASSTSASAIIREETVRGGAQRRDHNVSVGFSFNALDGTVWTLKSVVADEKGIYTVTINNGTRNQVLNWD